MASHALNSSSRRSDPTRSNSPKRFASPGAFLLACALLASVVVGGYLVLSQSFGGDGTVKTQLSEIPFNGAQAYEYLKQLCQLGPRPSGSPGMAAQQKLLTD